jgi:competence transcription factor ComK
MVVLGVVGQCVRDGSLQGSRAMRLSTQKPAVKNCRYLIDPYRQIYFFPTAESVFDAQCVWINATQIVECQSGSDWVAELNLYDHSILCLKLPLGPRSIKRQLKRIEAMRQRIITRNLFEDGVLSPRYP